MKVIGAGCGRTGTFSLKLALERLLGAPCYHMAEVFQHPEDVPVWTAASLDEPVDWHALMEGYGAAVDWPASAFYEELMAAFPEALVVHSVRDPEAWWTSATNTIFSGGVSAMEQRDPAWFKMISTLLDKRFTGKIDDKQACIDAFNRHNERVAKVVPADRLLVFSATQGWEPLCKALDLPIPDEPFPKANTTEEFIGRIRAAAEAH